MCNDCGQFFDEPHEHKEYHGEPEKMGETFYSCPNCRGDYKDAVICHGCGSYIQGSYIEVDASVTLRFCDECYRIIHN